MTDTPKAVAWPAERVNMPDPHATDDARIVGFRIHPGDPWYGLGLSDPLFALGDAIDSLADMQRRLLDWSYRIVELRVWPGDVTERDELVKEIQSLLRGDEKAGESDGEVE